MISSVRSMTVLKLIISWSKNFDYYVCVFFYKIVFIEKISDLHADVDISGSRDLIQRNAVNHFQKKIKAHHTTIESSYNSIYRTANKTGTFFNFNFPVIDKLHTSAKWKSWLCKEKNIVIVMSLPSKVLILEYTISIQY